MHIQSSINMKTTSHDELAEILSLTITVTNDGTQYRNSDGQLHRVHGPAVISSRGGEGWYQNGKRHRIDGPAVIYPSGDQYWFINDRLLTHREFDRIKWFLLHDRIIKGQ